MAIQLVIAGLLLGGIYALVTLGLTLVFGVLRVINFAHGQYLMVAMYLVYWLWAKAGIGPYAAIPISVAFMALFGVVTYKFVVEPSVSRGAMAQNFATQGLGLVLQSLALALFTADYLSVRTDTAAGSVVIGTVSIENRRLLALGVAIIVALALGAVLKWTYLGKAVRAVTQNAKAASLMGVDVRKVRLITFSIGSAFLGIAAPFLSPIYPVYPRIGLDFVQIAFVVAVLGGLGSAAGSIFAGLLVGVVETVTGYYLGSEWKQAVYFLMFIMVLLVRPAGLMGQRGAEEVGLK